MATTTLSLLTGSLSNATFFAASHASPFSALDLLLRMLMRVVEGIGGGYLCAGQQVAVATEDKDEPSSTFTAMLSLIQV